MKRITTPVLSPATGWPFVLAGVYARTPLSRLT
jgi:hypothetical protein